MVSGAFATERSSLSDYSCWFPALREATQAFGGNEISSKQIIDLFATGSQLENTTVSVNNCQTR